MNDRLLYEGLTYKIIGAAREVYSELGTGYLGWVYEAALRIRDVKEDSLKWQ